MPEPQQQPVQQPAAPPQAKPLQWYSKKGPDGKWYKTQAGSPEEAVTKMSKAWGGTASGGVTQPSQTAARKPVAAKQQQPGFFKRYGQTMMVPTSKPELESAMKGASGAGYAYQTGKNVYEGVRAAIEDAKAGRLMKAAVDFVGPLSPFPSMLGTNIGEDIKGKNYKGLAGTTTGLATQALLMKGGVEINPESLRTRAAELDTKVLKTAEAGARDYKTSVGLQVANEQLVGTMKSLPGKIEQVRAAKNAKVEALAQYYDSRGAVVDAEQGLAPRLRNIAIRLNTRGLLDTKAVNALKTELGRIQNKIDMQTGQPVPRNLSKMSVHEALELSKGLGERVNWDASTQVAVEPFVKEVRQVLNEAIDKVDPEIGKTRAEESKLITARNAARENYTKMLNDKTTLGRGVLYSGVSTIAAYLGMRAIGVFPVAAIGSVVMLRALAASTLSRTVRAALYARAAELLDRSAGVAGGPQGAANAAGGPNVPPGGGGPRLPANTPKGAANAGAGHPTTASPQAGGLPPMPASPLPKTPTALPEIATRARAGSGNYVKGASKTPTGRPLTPQEAAIQSGGGGTGVAADITKWQPPPESGVSNIGDIEKRVAANRAKMGPQPRSGGQSGAPPTTTSPRMKAMMDRLDTLLTREPRSGAENNAIKREIAEIKRVLSGEATGSEASAINKRIADRERLASKRAAAGATQTGGATAGGGETVSQSASPEMRAIALDAGYKALAKYEGGPEMVKALQSTAKAMQKVDPSYDEIEKLTEALTVLRQLGPSN